MHAKNCWRGKCLGLAALSFLLATSPSRADLIPFDLVQPPDAPIITALTGSLLYDAGSGQFHSETDPFLYVSGLFPDGAFFLSGLTTIDLTVDLGGNFVANGTGLKVTGEIDFDGDNVADVSGDDTDPLLSGRIYAFGAQPGGTSTWVFNGLWEIEHSKLSEFPVGDQPGGFFLFAEGVTGGTDFQESFLSDSVKDNVGIATPAPPGLLLGLVGGSTLAGFAFVRRRRGRPRRAN